MKHSERTVFVFYLYTIYATSRFSLMQLRQFFHETRSDQSVQKGNDLFSKILVERNCRTAKTAWCGGVASRSMAIEAPATESRGPSQRVRPGERFWSWPGEARCMFNLSSGR